MVRLPWRACGAATVEWITEEGTATGLEECTSPTRLNGGVVAILVRFEMEPVCYRVSDAGGVGTPETKAEEKCRWGHRREESEAPVWR